MRNALALTIVLIFAVGGAVAAETGDVKDKAPTKQNLGMSDFTLGLVGHAHIDLAYRWRWNETVRWIVRDTFRGVLDLMQKEPKLTFAQSQMALYDAVKREYPEMYREIKDRIAEGRWIPVGGMWCEPDMMFPSGESFVRQRLIGMQFARQEFGTRESGIMWVPDSFCGHAGTLPRILNRCGIKYYIVGRGAPKEMPVFWWSASDDEQILAYSPAAPYNLQLTSLSERGLQSIQEWSRKAGGIPSALLLYGTGDHGGGPRMEDVMKKRAISKWRGVPKIEYVTPDGYFRDHIASYEAGLPVYRGSLAGLTNTSYLSQARQKQLNRQCENLLLTAEKLATLGVFYQRKPSYPRTDFADAWKTVLFNQFHDIIAGTSNGCVYDDAEGDYQEVIEESNRLLEEGIEHIATRIDTRGDGVPLIVFNPLSWTRSDIVEITIRFLESTNSFSIVDDHGDARPMQILNTDDTRKEWRVAFIANEIPSIGYKLFRVRPNRAEPSKTDLKATPTTFENEYLRVGFSPTGTLLSVFDKIANREILGGEANTFAMAEDTMPSSSWTSVLGNNRKQMWDTRKPEVIEAGPVRAVLRRTFRSEDSAFVVDTILCTGSPRVEFRLNADWHDRDVTMLAEFPTSIAGGTGAIEMPYGHEEVKPDGTRRCAQQWVDLSNEDFGVSILNNGRYEFYLDGGAIRMGVLRGARDMDPRMDEGKHELQYALYPHAGSWRDSDTVRHAYALNNPLIAVQESHHTGQTDSWLVQKCDFSLPSAQSFVAVSNKNVVVPVVKIPQEEWTTSGELIVRLFETSGRPAECTLTLASEIHRAIETDHLEEQALGKLKPEKNRVLVSLKPGEIKTLKLGIGPSGSVLEGN